MSELLPCPFCGGEAVFNAYDRLISIGCGKCGYTRGFKGLLTTEPHGKPVSREGAPVVEYYNKNAHKEAIESWNTRHESTCEGCTQIAPSIAAPCEKCARNYPDLHTSKVVSE